MWGWEAWGSRVGSARCRAGGSAPAKATKGFPIRVMEHPKHPNHKIKNVFGSEAVLKGFVECPRASAQLFCCRLGMRSSSAPSVLVAGQRERKWMCSLGFCCGDKRSWGGSDSCLQFSLQFGGMWR